MQADIGLGFLIAIFTSSVFHFEPTLWFIVFCVLSALLPDIDFLLEFAIHHNIAGKEIREHRELLHFPASYIPFVALVWFLAGPMWGVALLCGILTHFIHDSIGIGWGIAWLWPFSKRNYKLFAGKNGYISWNFLQSWAHHEMPALASSYGIENWVWKIYIKPFPIRVPVWLLWVNVAEWVIFAIGALSLWMYLT